MADSRVQSSRAASLRANPGEVAAADYRSVRAAFAKLVGALKAEAELISSATLGRNSHDKLFITVVVGEVDRTRLEAAMVARGVQKRFSSVVDQLFIDAGDAGRVELTLKVATRDTRTLLASVAREF